MSDKRTVTILTLRRDQQEIRHSPDGGGTIGPGGVRHPQDLHGELGLFTFDPGYGATAVVR